MTTKKPANKTSAKATNRDDFQTPPYALQPLLPYLVRGWTVWECACGKGLLVDALLREGLKVIWSDIKRDKTEDFLTCRVRKADCIVTNPPYGLKDEFLKRCYEIGKPFALLMPIESLGGQERQYYYSTRGIQLILMDKRVDFLTPSGKPSSAWFPVAWFTWGLNLPKDLLFTKICKEAK